MKNKLLGFSIALLVAISLLAITTLLLIKFVLTPPATQADGVFRNMDEMAAMSINTGEMTTNLKDNRYAVMEYTIILSNKKAKDEAEKGLFLIKREILGVLSSMDSTQLVGDDGVKKMEDAIQKRIDSILKEGKVVRVVTTRKIVQ
ncbi:putative Flagellar basal body-associated protein [[Clostridium] ultunense Esp]|uniref:flagellar basal body-associated FliL family protein n=1 Tax=Thermicanus aegyptius TaxID=94009 RepID=UPI0002B6F716|nr:flagellar basal body-associated FliL family protein [Thermicanus aegyptius]CCQ97774.1 putative Flagellar basal body-associated protein [[Clostridium] ultunense Esp]